MVTDEGDDHADNDVEDMRLECDEIYLTSQDIGVAIADGGATKPIIGTDTWTLWLQRITELGMADHVVYQPCRRRFRFGNQQVLVSTRRATFRASFFGSARECTAWLVPGSTPFLLARPLLEEWGVVHDFRNKKWKLLDDEARGWFAPEQSAQGQYLVNLLDFPARENREDRVMYENDVEDEIDPDSTDSHVTKHKLSRQKVIWEVFSGQGHLQDQLQHRPEQPVHAAFGLGNGWDFSIPSHRREFLAGLRDVQPDEVWLSPPCRLWSTLQEWNVSQLGRSYAEKLQKERDHNEENLLRFTRRIYDIQLQSGRHAHIEHPWASRAWRTSAFSFMKGYEARLDQCAFGLAVNIKGQDLPVRKSTRIRTTKLRLASGIARSCQCTVPHGHLIGGRAKATENYNPCLSAEIARLMCQDDDDEAYPVDEDGVVEMNESKELLRKLRAKFDVVIIREITLLHHHLGHPSPQALADHLTRAGYDPEYISCARAFECAECLAQQLPKDVRIATIPKAKFMNHVVQVDTMHLRYNGKKKKVFVMQDEYTRFEMDAVIRRETWKKESKLLEKHWVSIFGPPKVLRADMSGAHMSDQFKAWCEGHGVRLELIPKFAHHRLGMLEASHRLRRKQLRIFVAPAEASDSSRPCRFARCSGIAFVRSVVSLRCSTSSASSRTCLGNWTRT